MKSILRFVLTMFLFTVFSIANTCFSVIDSQLVNTKELPQFTNEDEEDLPWFTSEDEEDLPWFTSEDEEDLPWFTFSKFFLL